MEEKIVEILNDIPFDKRDDLIEVLLSLSTKKDAPIKVKRAPIAEKHGSFLNPWFTIESTDDY